MKSSAKFTTLNAPWVRLRERHSFGALLSIARLATINGASGFEAMAKFCQTNQGWLRGFLNLSEGLPSDHTFSTLFRIIKPEVFHRYLVGSGGLLLSTEMHDLNMKRFGGRRFSWLAPKVMGNVTVWIGESDVLFGQLYADSASKEEVVISQLIELLDMREAIITLDARRAQAAFAAQIVANGGAFVIPLTERGTKLRCDVERAFKGVKSGSSDVRMFSEFEMVSGMQRRVESREVLVLYGLSRLHEQGLWPDVSSIVRVDRKREVDDQEERSTTDYVTSVGEERGGCWHALRRHWGRGRGIYWTLDMSYAGSGAQFAKDHSAENLLMLKSVALNRTSTTRRLRAGWDY